MANPVRTYAQADYSIQGRVIDAQTGQPLPFVTLSVSDGQVSNETNGDGYFRLHLPTQFRQDTLRITALNYPLTKLPLHTLCPTTSVIRLTARSAQAITPIEDRYYEATLVFQARDTLLKAVASIARNYTSTPTLLRGFYRETIQKQQPELCVSYAEGLIEVYKPSYYFTKKDDQIRFIKGRRKPLTTFIIPVLTPGPWVSNMLDIVKYQEFLFRNGTLNKNYMFALVGQTLIGDQSVYVIDFKPRTPYATGGYFAGTLFLAAGSLAIIWAEYELTEQGLSLINKSGYAQVYSTSLQKRSYTVTYTQFNNHWSFQSGSVENTFRGTPANSLFRSRVDFVVTHRQSGTIKPFTVRQQAVYTKLPMQSFDKTNDTFWDDENQLLPAYPLPSLVSGSVTP